MDKGHPPESFGVFKPVGHTVIAFRTTADLESAMAALAQQGFSAAAMVSYAPQEMVQQSQAEAHAAGPLAGFGYELDLVKVHLALAQQGCSFLVVHAPNREQAEQVAAVARSLHAASAQHYGRFMIEDVIGSADPVRPVPTEPTPQR